MAGDLCKITSKEHPFKDEIVSYKQMEYYYQCPCYIFETFTKKRVVLNSDNQFTTLPFKGSIEFLISLALQTNDQAWFNELVFKLKYESQ